MSASVTDDSGLVDKSLKVAVEVERHHSPKKRLEIVLSKIGQGKFEAKATLNGSPLVSAEAELVNDIEEDRVSRGVELTVEVGRGGKHQVEVMIEKAPRMKTARATYSSPRGESTSVQASLSDKGIKLSVNNQLYREGSLDLEARRDGGVNEASLGLRLPGVVEALNAQLRTLYDEDVFKLDSEVSVNGDKMVELSSLLDISKKSAEIKAKLKDFFIIVSTSIKSSNAVTVDITSSLRPFSSVSLEGEWEKTVGSSPSEKKYTLSASGKVNSDDVRFEAELETADGELRWSWTAMRGLHSVSAETEVKVDRRELTARSFLDQDGRRSSLDVVGKLEDGGIDLEVNAEAHESMLRWNKLKIKAHGVVDRRRKVMDLEGTVTLENDSAKQPQVEFALKASRDRGLLEVNVPALEIKGKVQLDCRFKRLEDFNVGAGFSYGRKYQLYGLEYGLKYKNGGGEAELGAKASYGLRMDRKHLALSLKLKEQFTPGSYGVGKEFSGSFTSRGKVVKTTAALKRPSEGKKVLKVEATLGDVRPNSQRENKVLDLEVTSERGRIVLKASLPQVEQLTLRGTLDLAGEEGKIEGELSVDAVEQEYGAKRNVQFPIKASFLLDRAASHLDIAVEQAKTTVRYGAIVNTLKNVMGHFISTTGCVAMSEEASL